MSPRPMTTPICPLKAMWCPEGCSYSAFHCVVTCDEMGSTSRFTSHFFTFWEHNIAYTLFLSPSYPPPTLWLVPFVPSDGPPSCCPNPRAPWLSPASCHSLQTSFCSLMVPSCRHTQTHDSLSHAEYKTCTIYFSESGLFCLT